MLSSFVALGLAAANPQLSGTTALQQAATVADNQEMTEMFEADQAIRMEMMGAIKPDGKGGFTAEGDVIKRMMEGDKARYARTSEMYGTGDLVTANDYYHAAYIFQHGSEPADYLRAHHTAIVAIKLGHESAPWIAAASLDRYLLSIGQDQIYGTQSRMENGETIASPVQEGVITDAERAKVGVPPLAKAE